MIKVLILFIIGFFILIKGANLLVKGGSALAKYLGVSGFVIGLLAGIGTSTPEFAITVISNILGKNDVGIGTIIGSNIFNFLFILGICALFYPIYFKSEWIRRDLVWNIFAILITGIVSINGIIGRVEGIILLLICTVWIIVVAKTPNKNSKENTFSSTLAISFLLSIAGLVGILAGSYFIVDGATYIANEFGVSEYLIGLLIIGIGTSLPEITVSFVASKKGQYGIAVGNIVGSNIFDFLGIIGTSALFIPINFNKLLIIDLLLALASAILITILVTSNKKYRLGRTHGLLLIVLFVMYMIFVVNRG